MHSAARCAGHSAARSKSAYFSSDFVRTPALDIQNMLFIMGKAQDAKIAETMLQQNTVF